MAPRSKVVARIAPATPGARLVTTPRAVTLTGRLRDVPGMPTPDAVVRAVARQARRPRRS